MRRLVLFMCLGCMVMSDTDGLGAQALTAEEESAARAEINASMDNYYALYSNGELDQLVEELWLPGHHLLDIGVVTIEDYRLGQAQFQAGLRDRGYDRSRLPERNICLLTRDVAFVSGHGFRYRADGTVLDERGWTYTLLRSAEGWRIVGTFEHDPTRAVTCEAAAGPN